MNSTRIYIFILFLILFSVSCSKDNDDMAATFDGKWLLKDIKCFCGVLETGTKSNRPHTVVFNTVDSTATFVHQ